MLYNLMKNGFVKEENYNCSEKILYGLNQAYNLNLSKEALVMSGGFGGGMGVESTCGALTGGIMGISAKVIKDNAKSSQARDLVAYFLTEYQNRMSSINCKELKEEYYSEDNRCDYIILEASKLLDEIFTSIQ